MFHAVGGLATGVRMRAEEKRNDGVGNMALGDSGGQFTNMPRTRQPAEGGRRFYRRESLRSSASAAMNPIVVQPPEATARSNHRRAWAVSPRTRYQLPTP